MGYGGRADERVYKLVGKGTDQRKKVGNGQRRKGFRVRREEKIEIESRLCREEKVRKGIKVEGKGEGS